MTIASLKPGQTAVVDRITASGALRQRLLDVGFLPGTTVTIERAGIGGHPLWIRCQGASMALRRAEATSIVVI